MHHVVERALDLRRGQLGRALSAQFAHLSEEGLGLGNLRAIVARVAAAGDGLFERLQVAEVVDALAPALPAQPTLGALKAGPGRTYW